MNHNTLPHKLERDGISRGVRYSGFSLFWRVENNPGKYYYSQSSVREIQVKIMFCCKVIQRPKSKSLEIDTHFPVN